MNIAAWRAWSRRAESLGRRLATGTHDTPTNLCDYAGDFFHPGDRGYRRYLGALRGPDVSGHSVEG